MKQPRSIARQTLEQALQATLVGLEPGRVLDVGAKDQPYKGLLRVAAASDYLTLDVEAYEGVDIIGDIHDLDWPDADFDTIVMTEVLEHLHSPQRAVSEIERLLKPGGLCILSTRFFHPYHPDPHDYFRFTTEGLRHLFSDFATVEIQPLGNRLHTAWLTLTHGQARSLRVLSGLFTPWVRRLGGGADERWACGFLVKARKGLRGREGQ